MRIPRSVQDLQVERESLFWDFSSQRLFHGLDLFLGQWCQQFSFCAVVSDAMSCDGECECLVQVLMDDRLASGQGIAPVGALELHHQVVKAYGLIDKGHRSGRSWSARRIRGFDSRSQGYLATSCGETRRVGIQGSRRGSSDHQPQNFNGWSEALFQRTDWVRYWALFEVLGTCALTSRRRDDLAVCRHDTVSNHRITAFDGQRVSFLWRDYAHGGKQRVMTLDAVNFLCRFFLHVLPKGFVRIRRYGLLSNRFRKQLLPLARTLLAEQGREPMPLPPLPDCAPWHCPRCGKAMRVVQRFTAAELYFAGFDSS